MKQLQLICPHPLALREKVGRTTSGAVHINKHAGYAASCTFAFKGPLCDWGNVGLPVSCGDQHCKACESVIAYRMQSICGW